MTGGYQTEIAQLTGHQKALQAIAAKGDQVVAAGHELTPLGWDNAYGLLCQPFPLAVNPLVTLCLKDLAKLIDAIGQTATAIGQAAQQYQQHEDQTHARLKQLGKPLDDLVVSKPAPRGGVRIGEPMPRRGVAVGEPELPGQER